MTTAISFAMRKVIYNALDYSRDIQVEFRLPHTKKSEKSVFEK